MLRLRHSAPAASAVASSPWVLAKSWLLVAIMLVASTAQAVHSHASVVRTNLAAGATPSQVTMPPATPQDDPSAAVEFCPLCMAMHATSPATMPMLAAPVATHVAVAQRPEQPLLPRPPSHWFFSRPPPASFR